MKASTRRAGRPRARPARRFPIPRAFRALGKPCPPGALRAIPRAPGARRYPVCNRAGRVVAVFDTAYRLRPPARPPSVYQHDAPGIRRTSLWVGLGGSILWIRRVRCGACRRILGWTALVDLHGLDPPQRRTLQRRLGLAPHPLLRTAADVRRALAARGKGRRPRRRLRTRSRNRPRNRPRTRPRRPVRPRRPARPTSRRRTPPQGWQSLDHRSGLRFYAPRSWTATLHQKSGEATLGVPRRGPRPSRAACTAGFDASAPRGHAALRAYALRDARQGDPRVKVRVTPLRVGNHRGWRLRYRRRQGRTRRGTDVIVDWVVHCGRVVFFVCVDERGRGFGRYRRTVERILATKHFVR